MPKNLLFFLAFLIAFYQQIAFVSFANADEATPAVASPTPVVDDEDRPLNDGISVLDRPSYSPDRPSYEKINPRFAFGLRASIHGFPTSSALGDSYQLFGEYLFGPQQIGIFSVGASIGMLPLYAPETQIPSPNYENVEAGVSLRYQLRVVENQWLVPTAAIDWQYYRIRESSFSYNQLMGSEVGVAGGLMLNLGIFDTVTAREAYQSIGLVRSYFTVELRSTNINNELFTVTGSFWYFGLRLEFE